MKSYWTAWLGICCLFAFALPCSAIPKIGYGSSDAVLPAKNQELFFMGFELGFQQTLNDKTLSHLINQDQVADGSQLGAIEAAKRLVRKGAVMLVGFPTSHEALLAGRVANENDILLIASGAGHSDLAKMGQKVYTTGESMDYSVRSTLAFIRKLFPKKRGLILSNPYAVFSKNHEDTFLSVLKEKEYDDIHLDSGHFEKDLTLNSNLISLLKSGIYDFIVITAYADESVQLLQQLAREKVDLPMVANTSWTTGDVEFGRRFLIARNAPVYSASLWQPGSKDSLPFEALIEKRYGRKATAENAYGYDLGVVTATIVNRVQGELTRQSVIDAFKKDLCFDGLTSGRICFDRDGGHAETQIQFVRFTKKGFVPVNWQ